MPAQYAGGFDVIVPAASLQDPTVSLAGLVSTLAEFSGWRQDAAFVWDGAPGARPFLFFGPPPAGVSTLVTVADGRIRSGGFDLSSFRDGIVLQCVRGPGSRGMVLTTVGDPGTRVPAYGREEARLVTEGGGGFVVSRTGQVVSSPEVRAESPR
ncbi:hypothetical protein [Rhodococcus sp. X156]|uniref:hypothetical protein n=1 Tax=Rhodococcus sp. X156 TaxID=2499145 RepID=UPI000FD7CC12|nr:hypothetical protein [Rhodococcus sp. X156]